MSVKKIIANDIKVGCIIEHDKRLWNVLKRDHVKPGKGPAYIQVVMKDVRGETKMDHRFNSNANVMLAYLEEYEYRFLFVDKTNVTLIASENCDQLVVPRSVFGDKAMFLQDDMVVIILKYDEEIISVKLPDSVVLVVLETDPYIKGQTAAASFKPAVMENGLRVMVPPFIKAGDKLVINTNDGTYVERYKE